MSIRLRNVPGIGLVAICAARSIPKPGDIYLDDNAHQALSIKFVLDYASMGFLSERAAGLHADSPTARTMEREESNNTNRDWWDQEYGSSQAE